MRNTIMSEAMSVQRTRPRTSLFTATVGVALVAVLLVATFMALQRGPAHVGSGIPKVSSLHPASPDPRKPKSIDCRKCHSDIYAAWASSHHALANRLPDEREGRAFTHPGLKGETIPKADGDRLSLQLNGVRGPTDHRAEMVIGHDPLRQYLLPWPDGGWQTTQVAWDTHRQEWFDIYDDGRGAGEWGAWTGRGMNWNASCAYCHMTDFEKNYDPEADRYTSAWHEQGVGCIQCHAPTLASPPPDRVAHCGTMSFTKHFDNCAACHSRRGDLDGAFRPGDVYPDHFHLQLPTRAGLYFPDGQIRDEVYVWTSLQLSSMGHAGVRCLDCHNPHTNALILPAQDNTLCQRCHATGALEAPVIKPEAHSFHPEGTSGARCVECHMPHTTYMGRDPRRDHGFHNPDPALTLELSIPNACARCHNGQDPEAERHTTAELAEYASRWWGENMNAAARDRARVLAAAYEGDEAARAGLMRRLKAEKNPYWQATYIELLEPWTSQEDVRGLIARLADSAEPRVRASVTQVLAPHDEGQARTSLADPIRSVRHLAASVRPDLLTDFPSVAAELNAEIRYNADQPGGAVRYAREHLRNGRPVQAEKWFRRALAHDDRSASIFHEFAFFLNAQGRSREAIVQLLRATELAPEDPVIPFHLGLAFAETRAFADARRAFELSIAREPNFARAHYNLGLLLAERGDLEAAITSISRAEQADLSSPEYPYARATLHLRQDDLEAARDAVRKSLLRDPNHLLARRLESALGL